VIGVVVPLWKNVASAPGDVLPVMEMARSGLKAIWLGMTGKPSEGVLCGKDGKQN
jgi:hypothetical protein